jgi:pimeloyl-ACP methyl ester carboxylesterase
MASSDPSISRFSRTVLLKDGRRLGYAELGSPDGHPCLFFHGNFHSRLSAAGGDARARRAGLRMIAIDRPGFGLSDLQPDRTLLDWPGDVVQLADYLDLEAFSIVGLSGGSGYAYACALTIPDRVSATAVVGGMVPADLPGFVDGMAPPVRMLHRLRAALGIFGVRPTRAVLRTIIGIGVRLERRRLRPWTGELPADLSEDDRAALLENPEDVIEAAMSDPLETFRQGVASFLPEFRIYSEPWGFRLEDIASPIDLYHGENDGNVHVSLARAVARRIRDCSPTFFADTGHNLSVEQWDVVLTRLRPDASS